MIHHNKRSSIIQINHCREKLLNLVNEVNFQSQKSSKDSTEKYMNVEKLQCCYAYHLSFLLDYINTNGRANHRKKK